MWISNTKTFPASVLWHHDRVAVTIVFDSYEVRELKQEHLQNLIRLLVKQFEAVKEDKYG